MRGTRIALIGIRGLITSGGRRAVVAATTIVGVHRTKENEGGGLGQGRDGLANESLSAMRHEA